MAEGILAGKRAFITGGAQGIGWAGARAFTDAGASVVVSDLNREKLDGLPRLDRMTTVQLDVADAAQVEQVASDVGPVDIILNCAGWIHYGSILETTLDIWERAFAINVTGMFSVIRAFLPPMMKTGGSIINIASVASSIRGRANRCSYGASKAAVIGLTKSVAQDYARYGISCNCVCPGAVLTPSLEERLAAAPSPQAMLQFLVDRQPVGRLGKPEELASLFVCLASDASRFMTGSEIIMDGGASL